MRLRSQVFRTGCGKFRSSTRMDKRLSEGPNGFEIPRLRFETHALTNYLSHDANAKVDAFCLIFDALLSRHAASGRAVGINLGCAKESVLGEQRSTV